MRSGVEGYDEAGHGRLGGLGFGVPGCGLARHCLAGKFKEENKVVYKFKEGSCIKADPQIVGEFCSYLSNNGGLTAKRLLEKSRDVSAPLHALFEWDDTIAAENYRQDQASHIIRSVVVETSAINPEPVRAFINIKREEREYCCLDVVVRSEDLYQQMLAAAFKEMEAFKQKYKSLSELSTVFSAVDDILNSQENE